LGETTFSLAVPGGVGNAMDGCNEVVAWEEDLARFQQAYHKRSGSLPKDLFVMKIIVPFSAVCLTYLRLKCFDIPMDNFSMFGGFFGHQ